MPLLSDETRYSLNHTLKRVGVGTIIKLVIVIGLFFWWIWPEETKQVPQQTAQQQTEPTIPASQPSTEDIRLLMTSPQSGFYWTTFIWMMEHGKDLTPRSFDGKTVFTRYIKDASFKAENGLNCRPYSEIVILTGKSNTRKGIACQIGVGSWCRQAEGEQAECRKTTPKGGLADIKADYSIGMHNMKLDWNNKLSQFGF